MIIARRNDKDDILFLEFFHDLIEQLRSGVFDSSVPGEIHGRDIHPGSFRRKHIFQAFDNRHGISAGRLDRHDLHAA